MKLHRDETKKRSIRQTLQAGLWLFACSIFLICGNGCDISPVPTPIPGESGEAMPGQSSEGYADEGEFSGGIGYGDPLDPSRNSSEPSVPESGDEFNGEGSGDEGNANSGENESTAGIDREREMGGEGGGTWEEGGEASEDGVSINDEDASVGETEGDTWEEEKDGCGSEFGDSPFEGMDAGSLDASENDANCF